MSEFKFACPVCGQHITCDPNKSGTQLDCPTCFQKLIVPDAPQGDVTKLILNASLAQSRPRPQGGAMTDTHAGRPACARRFPVGIIVLLFCAVGALFVFRGQIFKGSSQDDSSNPSLSATTNDPAWKLDLAGVTIPDMPVAGRISGRVFNSQHATLKGGVLMFRQGQNESLDLGLRITLFVREHGELAGKSINIETNHTRAPNVVFGWKDDPQQPLVIETPPDYALRLQFGAVADGRLPGKIYFCARDEAKSWVTGTFEAEILKAPPPKPQPPGAPKPQR
jgi:hypothetical protein